MTICAHCGEPARGYATVGDDRLCHPNDGLDCYFLVTVKLEPLGARIPGATGLGAAVSELKCRSRTSGVSAFEYPRPDTPEEDA